MAVRNWSRHEPIPIAVGTGDHHGRGRWDCFPVNGRAGVLALARPRLRPVGPPGRRARPRQTTTDTLPSMANPTPTSTPTPRPRRLSLFGPPAAVVQAFAKEMTPINQTHLLVLEAVIDLGLADPSPPPGPSPHASAAPRA
jgi:hypothetical protein